MSKEDYVWHMVFDDPDSHKRAVETLLRTAEYDGNENEKMVCPDGVARSVIMLPYKEIMGKFSSLRKGRDPIKFKIMKSWGTSENKCQWWPPGSDGTEPKAKLPFAVSRFLAKNAPPQASSESSGSDSSFLD